MVSNVGSSFLIEGRVFKSTALTTEQTEIGFFEFMLHFKGESN